MKAAVTRIVRAIKQEEPIVIYGDYDVDGITGTAILVKFIRRLGGRVTSTSLIGKKMASRGDSLLAEQGYKLVVTVDCGIAHEEIALGYSLGLEFVLTDHRTASRAAKS